MSPGLDERLSALLDGELPPAEAEALRAEIARSPALALQLAALAAVDERLRALPGPRVPGDLRARIESRLRVEASPRAPVSERRAPARAPSRRRRWLAAAALVAAAAAVLALVVLPQLRREPTQLVQREPEPQRPAVPAARPQAPAPAPVLEEPDSEDVALADDLPVIEVLDVLAELDELEEVGSG